MSIRAHLRAWTPPAITNARRAWLGHTLRFREASGDWAAAERESGGYAADLIVERVAQATREVIAGRAVFERDSVLFHEPDYRYPIVTALLHCAQANDGRLDVIDFGGSLGSTYRQCRPLLGGVRQLRWHVIEQPKFVIAGCREFTTGELDFAESVEELPPSDVPALILLSSVLQYLERPHEILDRLLARPASHLVIDRTPLSALDDDRLCVQQAPRSVYDASYPCWVLSRPRLLQRLTGVGWRVLGEFLGMEGAFTTSSGLSFKFRGFIAHKK
jgi:putative methyltransferase (TIGR04325 family)